jgi:hypothetical protein
MSFETQIFEMFNRVVRYLRTQPLILGGYAGSGGGQGGPPGGYAGYLPQTRVAYDEDEFATLATPSGATLLDNLNHIRYRLSSAESSGSAGLIVEEDNVIIASGIHVITFNDFFTVNDITSDKVSVSLLASGVKSDTWYSGVFSENLSSQINGVTAHFTIANALNDSSLQLYLNGIRQNNSLYTVDVGHTGFTTTFVPVSGDTLFVDYDIAIDGFLHTHGQYMTSGEVYTMDQMNLLLANKASLIHTHTIADITDLTDPLVVNQQIVFTIASSGCYTTGTKPLRIYAHDVNDSAEITEIFASFNTPPSAEMHLNVLKNGTTIFTSPAYMVIASGAYTTSRTTNFASDAFVKDDYFQIGITTGNAIASDMTLHIRFNYEL